MAKKKTKKVKSKTNKEKKMKLGTFKETAREKLLANISDIDTMLIYFLIIKR